VNGHVSFDNSSCLAAFPFAFMSTSTIKVHGRERERVPLRCERVRFIWRWLSGLFSFAFPYSYTIKVNDLTVQRGSFDAVLELGSSVRGTRRG